MDWQRNSQYLQTETLKYFAKYDYPLTKKELELWSHIPHPLTSPLLTKERGLRGEVENKNGYFFLKGRSNLINIRRQREKYSLLKWGIAYRYATKLAKISFIQAIFVTGSLAMNNCKKSDDIDFMIVTSPNTLWLTRFVVMLLFARNRRFPGQKIAPDKICTNLWVDTNNLNIKDKNLYHAHEILQAKCIFDRGGVQYQFLKQNSWVKEYLLNAYKFQIKNSKTQINSKLQVLNLGFMIYLVISILNFGFFVLQYLYMKPKMTTERVGLGYAFFHPK